MCKCCRTSAKLAPSDQQVSVVQCDHLLALLIGFGRLRTSRDVKGPTGSARAERLTDTAGRLGSMD